MLYKLEEGRLIQPTNPLITEEQQIFNPTEEILKENGYKELVVEEQPEYNPETQYLDTVFTETETTIVKSWVVKEIEFIEGEIE